MVAFKIGVVGLFALLFTLVQAQSNSSSACSNSTFTIQSQSDLDALTGCTTVTGTININAVAIDTVTFPASVETVNGDVNVQQISSLTTFTASGLKSITGTFQLLNLTGLQTLTAPSLTSVGGINFVILPLLATMTLGITEAGDVRISDTQLSSLSGFSLTTVTDFGIDNNRYLNSISQPELVEINGALAISANSPQLSIALPKLLTVQNASFRNIDSISIDSLQNVSSNLGFFDSLIPSISAPNVTLVGSSLSFDNCTALTNISFPKLTEIGGTFLIANNTDLTTISGFDSVQTIGGSIDWTGTFDNASLASISDVKGGVNVQSSSSTFQCPFPQIQSNGVVKGKGFVCTGKVANPSSGVNGTNQTANSGGEGGSNSTSSGSGTKSEGIQISASGLGIWMATVAGVAMLLQYV